MPDDVANSSTAQPHSHATRAPDRPRVAAAAQPAHADHVQHRDHDRRGAEDQVEAPVEQHARDGRRPREVVADRDLDGIDGLRSRRRVAACGPARRRCRTSARRPPLRPAPAGSAARAPADRPAARRARCDADAIRSRRARTARRPCRSTSQPYSERTGRQVGSAPAR